MEQLAAGQRRGLTYTRRYHMSRLIVVLGFILGVLGGSVSYLEVCAYRCTRPARLRVPAPAALFTLSPSCTLTRHVPTWSCVVRRLWHVGVLHPSVYLSLTAPQACVHVQAFTTLLN